MSNSGNALREEERLSPCTIPENFADTGRCFNGLFRTRNLIEGGILAAPIAKLVLSLDLPTNQKIVLTAIFAGGILLFCIAGINGDSVGEFFTHLVAYNKKKRIAKYNPRVKNEAMPGYLTKNTSELPRDKILRLFGSISKKAQDEEAVSSDIYDPIYKPFFADDFGYVDTPEDLKSKKQLRKEAKERKKAEKEKRRKEKALAKQKVRDEKLSRKKKGGKSE